MQQPTEQDEELDEEQLIVSLFAIEPSQVGLRRGSIVSTTNTTTLSSPEHHGHTITSPTPASSPPPLLVPSRCSTPSSVGDSMDRLGVEQQTHEVEERILNTRAVTPPDVQLTDLAERFHKSRVPQHPGSASEYMHNLVNDAVDDAVRTGSPNMIGHMTSSLPFFVRPLSRLIATMNQNVVKTETANTVTFLEREAIAQLHRSLYNHDDTFYEQHAQDPEGVLGIFTTGGTIANISALWAARNRALQALPDKGFLGVDISGVFEGLMAHGYKGMRVIGSSLLHYSMGKATDILGIGSAGLVGVPYDTQYRVRVDLVEQAVIKCQKEGYLVIAIMGVAGTTETGAVDPLDALANVAEKYKIHFHVDAAWGGPLIFSQRHKSKVFGIARADTVTMDGHKQLYMPMGCGLLFYRHPELSAAVRKTARYIIRKDSYDLGKFSLEGSRPANAMYLHSNLNILGVRGYEILVNRGIRITEYMAKCIEESDDFELIAAPTTNILLYRALPLAFRGHKTRVIEEDNKSGEGGDSRSRSSSITSGLHDLSVQQVAEINAFNIALQTAQKLTGRTFVSRTTVRSPHKHHQQTATPTTSTSTDADIAEEDEDGIPLVALRVVIANPLTYEADIDYVLRDQRKLMDVLEVVENADENDLIKDVAYDENKRASERASASAAAAMSSEEEDGGLLRRKSQYWVDLFDRSPDALKLLFKNNKELFLESLVAPDNELKQ